MSKRKLDVQKNRAIILATKLPPEIELNLRGRSRVAVRTVRDLETYITFVDELCRRHHNFYGHKKVISELVGISTNRISEWQKIWWAATKESNSPRVRQILIDKDVALSELIEALHEETSLHQAMEYLQRENGMVNANITSNSSSSTSPASLVQRHSSVERHLDTRLDFQSIEAPRHQTLSLSYNRIHELQKSSSATEEFIPQKSRYDSGNEIMSVAFDWGNKFSFSTNEVDLIAQSLRSSPQYTSLPSGTTESPLMIHSPQDDCKEKVFGMLNQDEDCEPFEFNVGDFELKDHFFVSDSKSKSERSLHESDPKSFAK